MLSSEMFIPSFIPAGTAANVGLGVNRTWNVSLSVSLVSGFVATNSKFESSETITSYVYVDSPFWVSVLVPLTKSS